MSEFVMNDLPSQKQRERYKCERIQELENEECRLYEFDFEEDDSEEEEEELERIGI